MSDTTLDRVTVWRDTDDSREVPGQVRGHDRHDRYYTLVARPADGPMEALPEWLSDRGLAGGCVVASGADGDVVYSGEVMRVNQSVDMAGRKAVIRCRPGFATGPRHV